MRDKLKLFGDWLNEEELVNKLKNELSKPEKGMTKEQMKTMQNLYKFGDPKTIFYDLRSIVKRVAMKRAPGALITGSPGVGKTFVVHDELKKLGLKSGTDYYDTGSGTSTAIGMYITLFEHNGQLIIFDDCDDVLQEKDGVNILKGAMQTNPAERLISWSSAITRKTESGEIIPKSFLFTGTIIFISNFAQAALPPVLQTRGNVLEVALSPTDMLSYIQKMLPLMYPEVPLPLKRAALHIVQLIAKTDPHVVLNMRTIEKATAILDTENDLTAALRQVQQQVSYDTKG